MQSTAFLPGPKTCTFILPRDDLEEKTLKSAGLFTITPCSCNPGPDALHLEASEFI